MGGVFFFFFSFSKHPHKYLALPDRKPLKMQLFRLPVPASPAVGMRTPSQWQPLPSKCLLRAVGLNGHTQWLSSASQKILPEEMPCFYRLLVLVFPQQVTSPFTLTFLEFDCAWCKNAHKRGGTLLFPAFCGCDQSHALFQCCQLLPLSSHYNFSLFLVPFAVSSSGLHITPSAELEELPGHWVGVVARAEGGL